MTTSTLDQLFGAQGGGDFLDVEGTFEFEITKAEPKPSNAGKPGLKLTMKVVGGPQEGKTQIHQLFYSPESEVALNILWRSLQSLGITREFAVQVASNLPEGNTTINQLFIEAAKIVVGRHVVAACAKDSGNPREEYRERIKVQFDLKAAPTAQAQTITPQDVASIPPPAPAPAPAPTPAPAPAPVQPDTAPPAPAPVPVGDAPPF